MTQTVQNIENKNYKQQQQQIFNIKEKEITVWLWY